MSVRNLNGPSLPELLHSLLTGHSASSPIFLYNPISAELPGGSLFKMQIRLLHVPAWDSPVAPHHTQNNAPPPSLDYRSLPVFSDSSPPPLLLIHQYPPSDFLTVLWTHPCLPQALCTCSLPRMLVPQMFTRLAPFFTFLLKRHLHRDVFPWLHFIVFRSILLLFLFFNCLFPSLKLTRREALFISFIASSPVARTGPDLL